MEGSLSLKFEKECRPFLVFIAHEFHVLAVDFGHSLKAAVELRESPSGFHRVGLGGGKGKFRHPELSEYPDDSLRVPAGAA